MCRAQLGFLTVLQPALNVLARKERAAIHIMVLGCFTSDQLGILTAPHRQRQTDRQKDRQTNRQTDTQASARASKHIPHTNTLEHANIQASPQTSEQASKQAGCKQASQQTWSRQGPDSFEDVFSKYTCHFPCLGMARSLSLNADFAEASTNQGRGACGVVHCASQRSLRWKTLMRKARAPGRAMTCVWWGELPLMLTHATVEASKCDLTIARQLVRKA